MNMRPPIPKPEPLASQRPTTTEELTALVKWGLKQGLLKWPTPPTPPAPPIDTEAKDFSPDLKRAMAEKKAEIGP